MSTLLCVQRSNTGSQLRKMYVYGIATELNTYRDICATLYLFIVSAFANGAAVQMCVVHGSLSINLADLLSN